MGDNFLEFTFDFVAVRDWRVQTRIDSRVDNAGQVAVDARPINLRGACSYNTECQQKLHRFFSKGLFLPIKIKPTVN